MKHRIIAISLGIMIFFTETHYAYADEVTFANFFLNPFKILIKKIDERKENKEVNKNIRNEIIEKRKNTTSVEYIEQMTLKLNEIANRIDSRIKKIENDGVDLAEAKKELFIAKNNISSTTPITTNDLIYTHDLLEKTVQLINIAIY